MDIKPNPGCANRLCRGQQQSFQERYNSSEAASARALAEAEASIGTDPIEHEDNEWLIEVVPEDSPSNDAAKEIETPTTQFQATQQLAAGLKFELPVTTSC